LVKTGKTPEAADAFLKEVRDKYFPDKNNEAKDKG
jgi:hypothetical protein